MSNQRRPRNLRKRTIRWLARWQNSYEDRCANRHETRCKIGPGSGSGHPKSTHNRSREPLGTPRGNQEHPDGISGASWGVLGAPRECPETVQGHLGTPERAPGSVWERPEETKIDTKSRPGAKKSIFFRAVRSRSVVGAIFRRFSLIFGFSVKSANPPKYCACWQKQRFGPSRRELSRSRDVTSKNLENRPENRPEIVENRLSERLGHPLGSPEAPEKPDFPANPEFPRHADAGMADP